MKLFLVPIFWAICLFIIFFLLIHIFTKDKRKNLGDVLDKITTFPI